MFFYRLDSGDSLSLNALGLYYNRNRWYSPSLGRFTSRDPNETAQLVLGTMLMNGRNFPIVPRAFDMTGHFGNGINLFDYVGSNPVCQRDLSGLMLGLAGGISYRAYMQASAAGAAAGAMGYFVAGVWQGMQLREAAYEAACFGVAAFATLSGAGELYFLMAETTLGTAAQLATTSGTLRGIVPLVSNLPQWVRDSFEGGIIRAGVTQTQCTFYRIYGGTAGRVGSFMTRTRYTSAETAARELALDPAWGNTKAFIVEVIVPEGTPIYEGAAAGGGGSQIYIELMWLRDYMFVNSSPLGA